MLNLINALKKQKHEPKVPIEQYLYSSDEPQDNSTSRLSAGLKDQLLEKGYFIKRRFKHLARRIRNYD